MNRYLAKPVTPGDVLWRFAGVRPLYDDGKSDPSAVTSDYTLRVDDEAGAAPVISVFGGKITTYRRLAAQVLGDGELGEYYGAGLCEREVRYLVEREWAVSAEDVLWRRSKAGLQMTPAQRERVAARLGSL